MNRRPPTPSPPARSSDTAANRLLTAEEIAELLAVPTRWIREHTRGGLIPHVRLGRYVRYRREAVSSWIEEQEQGGAAWRQHRPRRTDHS